jgi:hypothetical protein
VNHQHLAVFFLSFFFESGEGGLGLSSDFMLSRQILRYLSPSSALFLLYFSVRVSWFFPGSPVSHASLTSVSQVMAITGVCYRVW